MQEINRRNFFKVIATGAVALFLGGCSNSAAETKTAAAESKIISRGEKMKIVVITGSPHSDKESTSKYLAQRFIEGAKSAGHEIFTFDAANEKTNPCRGCNICGMDGDCVFDDAISKALMPKMLEADLLVLVTPLYYYGMSAQLKIIIDRFYSRTERLHRKKSLLLATAWNSADWTFTALQTHYETLVRYMEWQNVGAIYGTGCGYRSAVENSKFGDDAYKIGASL